MSSCEKCGGEIAERTPYCPHCGAVVRFDDDKSLCPVCRARINVDADFCPECGIMLKSNYNRKRSEKPKDYGKKAVGCVVAAYVLGIILIAISPVVEAFVLRRAMDIFWCVVILIIPSTVFAIIGLVFSAKGMMRPSDDRRSSIVSTVLLSLLVSVIAAGLIVIFVYREQITFWALTSFGLGDLI